MTLYRITYRDSKNVENTLPIIAENVHEAIYWLAILNPEVGKVTHTFPSV